MRWSDLPVTEQARLAGLYDSRQDMTSEAERLHMKRATLERYCREFLYYQRQLAATRAADLRIPGSDGPLYTDYLQLAGDNWLIMSDLEIPDHDTVMVELALKVAIAQGIKHGISAGDFLSMDGAGLTTWPEVWLRSQTKSFEEALGIGNDILGQLLEWLDEFYAIGGNHEERINKATKGAVHAGMLLRGVPFSPYRYLWIETTRGAVKVCHPQNYSASPVKLGQELYDVEPRKCHIVLGHTHIAQSGYTKDARYEVHTLGTMRDRSKTQYVSISANKHHHWTQSFLIIKDGYLYNLERHSTNWRLWLGELYDSIKDRI